MRLGQFDDVKCNPICFSFLFARLEIIISCCCLHWIFNGESILKLWTQTPTYFFVVDVVFITLSLRDAENEARDDPLYIHLEITLCSLSLLCISRRLSPSCGKHTALPPTSNITILLLSSVSTLIDFPWWTLKKLSFHWRDFVCAALFIKWRFKGTALKPLYSSSSIVFLGEFLFWWCHHHA